MTRLRPSNAQYRHVLAIGVGLLLVCFHSFSGIDLALSKTKSAGETTKTIGTIDIRAKISTSPAWEPTYYWELLGRRHTVFKMFDFENQ